MNVRKSLLFSLPLAGLSACGGGSGGHSGMGPSALHYSENFTLYVVDESHAPLVPTVSGAVTQWSISPALPSGLDFDLATGEITGTPHVSALRTNYVVSASNASGVAQTTLAFAVEKPARYAYVTCGNDRTIGIYAIDGQTGMTTRRGFVAGQAWEGHLESFHANPQRPFGYSTTGEGVITTWTVDEASGWLTELDVLALDFGPHAIAVSPDGRFVYVVQQNDNGVTVFDASAPNGLLTQVGPGIASGPRPNTLAISPDGSLMAVGCQGDATSGLGSMMMLFSIDPQTGALAHFGPSLLLNGVRPSACAFAPDQDTLFVSLPETARVVSIGFNRATGHMQSLGGSFSGTDVASLVCDPHGQRVWAVNPGAGTMSTFDVQSDGSIVAAGSLPAGTAPGSMAVDPAGRFLLAVDAGAQELAHYDLDGSSGVPARGASWLTRAQPLHVSFGRGEHALSSTNLELLAADFGSSELRVHPLDGQTGAIDAGSALPTGMGPLSVAVEPRQRFAYTGNAQDNSISRFQIDGASGALTELLPRAPTTGVPVCVTLGASGRFLYAAMREVNQPTDGFVYTFGVDASTGALALLGSVVCGYEPNWLGVDPTGQFLYVANAGNGTTNSATIAVFRLSAATGMPTGSPLVQPAPAVSSLGFHPTGRYLYAALRTSGTAVPFAINKADGSLSALGAGVPAVHEPMAVSVTPDGAFAYVACRNGTSAGTIELYAIDAATGTLVTPASPFLDGIAPLAMCVDPSGRFLYSANSGTDSISAYSISGADGFLQPLTPAPSGLAPSALALLQRWQ
ncbi:MAG: beta-propeller fold lactonase family protein [Planctomycetes bacterium]|nr:beta-propeller fold lactonase family protein [Planctomycetota bacterium]